jgi:hypothetical protein
MPVTEDTDLEIVALSQNKRFWAHYDRSIKRGVRSRASSSTCIMPRDVSTATAERTALRSASSG